MNEMTVTPSTSQRRRRISQIIRILVSTVLMVVLLSRLSYQEVVRVLNNLTPFYMIFIPVAYFANLYLSAFKWKILLANFGMQEKLNRLAAIYLIGVFFSNFLPTTIGGDAYRFVKMRGIFPGQDEPILASIILERGYGFLIACIINLLLAAYYRSLLSSYPVLLWIEASIMLGFLVLFLVWRGQGLFQKLFGRFDRWNVFQLLQKMVDLLKKQDLKIILVCSLISFFFILIIAFSWQIYYQVVGYHIQLVFLLYTVTLTTIAGILPITLNGLGLVELIQVLLLNSQGVPLEAVLIASLTSRVFGIVLSSLGGFLYLLQTIRPARSTNG